MAPRKTSARSGLSGSLLSVPVLLLIGFLVLQIGVAIGLRIAKGQETNISSDSAEAAFARDMEVHHAQAVEMAMIIRDRSEDAEVRLLAFDIALTQQAQIGQMQGWFAIWDLPLTGDQPAMSWMGMPTEGLMPGMATPEQMEALRQAQGVEADGLFLQLMIPHHRAGIEMAKAILDRTEQDAVRRLAQSIIDSQSGEIDYMQDLLDQRGFARVP